MAQLIEPDGTNGLITTVADAVAHCAAHPGWTWAHYDGGGSD